MNDKTPKVDPRPEPQPERKITRVAAMNKKAIATALPGPRRPENETRSSFDLWARF